MTWNSLAQSQVNVTAWQNGGETVTIVIGTTNAILDPEQRAGLAQYLLNGLDYRVVAENQYESLKDDRRWRACVEDAGVDNWDGYSYAMQEYRGDDDE